MIPESWLSASPRNCSFNIRPRSWGMFPSSSLLYRLRPMRDEWFPRAGGMWPMWEFVLRSNHVCFDTEPSSEGILTANLLPYKPSILSSEHWLEFLGISPLKVVVAEIKIAKPLQMAYLFRNLALKVVVWEFNITEKGEVSNVGWQIALQLLTRG